MERYAILVAGGKGLRMGGDIPKQFLPIGGKPVLMHTIEVFRQAYPDIHIVLVLPAPQQDYWLKLCRDYDFAVCGKPYYDHWSDKYMTLQKRGDTQVPNLTISWD